MKVRSTKTLASAIYEATKDKSGAELSDAISNSVEFIEKNNLMGKKNEILSHLEKIIDKEEHILRAKVSSSQLLSKKMTDELEDNLKKRYKAREVTLDISEDKSLIHGIKIEVNDEIIDLSLRNQLHKLQTHLIKN